MASKQVKDLFYPILYPKYLTGRANVEFCLIKSKYLGRYSIAYIEVSEIDQLNNCMNLFRREIAKITGAIWLLREVGVFIIIEVKNEIPKELYLESLVDKTGFHSVIIQGICLFNEKEQRFAKSKWFKHSFGDSDQILSKLVS
ncbi:hypothetical protein [Paraglaciecola sp. 25GB23A]|uniref:hypothetical protein n=1 Tax=Paraglaciecola sp. 25GB23A TaxID=3156068 RepID=UPI0032AF3CD6